MNKKNTYIELKRVFRAVNDKYDENNPNALLWDYTTKTTSLRDIIDSNRFSVILGDKGAGKTKEIEHLYGRLLNEGKHALFFSLDDLASKKIKIDKKSFKTWKSGDDNCYIFLDSIDECRLKESESGDSFKDAIFFLKKELGVNERYIYVITSRESEWRRDADKKIIIEKLGVKDKLQGDMNKNFATQTKKKTEEKNVKEENIFVCGLLPLESDQVEKIAKECSLANVKDFMKSIKGRCIPSIFYETPIECIDTISYFKRYNCFPSKILDMLKHKLHFRYRELNKKYGNDNNLTIDKIEKISKRLATSSILCHKTSIIANEDYDTFFESNADFNLGNSLSLYDLFPDEETCDLKHYIGSTLFSSNGLNRVKFYNEFVKNYVVFLWLEDRISRNRYKDIKSLLFQTVEGKLYPRCSLILPIIMLAEKEYEFREILIDNTPEYLIKYSGYSELSNIDKLTIFKNLYEKYPHRIRNLIFNSFGDYENEMGTYYFANECLIPYIEERFEIFNFEGQALVLSLLKFIDPKFITRGIEENILWKIINDKENSGLKSEAMSVLVGLQNNETYKRLGNLLKDNPKLLTEYGFYLAISNLYPEYLSIEDIIKLFSQVVEDETVIRSRDYSYYLDSFLFELYLEEPSNLVKAIKTVEVFGKEVVTENPWLTISIIESLKILLSDDLCEQSIIEHIVFLQKVLNNLEKDRYYDRQYSYRIRRKIEELRPLIKANMRNKFIEKLIESYVENPADIEKMLWAREGEYNLYGIGLDDLPLFIDSYNKMDIKDKKEVLRTLIIRFWSSDGFYKSIDPFIVERECKAYVDENIKRRKEAQCAPVKQHKSYMERDKIMEENKKFLLKNLNNLKNAKDITFKALLEISYENMDRYGSDDDNRVRITDVEEAWGKKIAKAYVKGAQKFWTSCELNDYNEYLDLIGKNKILNKSIIALAGICLSLEDSDFEIDDNKAKRMVYFGIQALNSLPKWLDGVFIKFPDASKEVIETILNKFFEVSEESYSLIDKLSIMSPKAIDILYNFVWSAIINNRIKHNNILKSSVKLILNSSNPNKENIVKYLSNKIDLSNYKDSIGWLKIIFYSDMGEFIRLIDFIEQNTDSKEFSDFIVILLSNIEDSRLFDTKPNDLISLDHMKKLLPMVFKYITPKDDLHHTGTFSPNARDNAQSFRHKLINMITNRKYNKEDRKKLIELSECINDEWYKELVLRQADHILIDDTDLNAKKEIEIINFEKGDDFPSNNAEELHRIVLNKLDDIKCDIELSDHSIKELYHYLAEVGNDEETKKIKNETIFQKTILKHMRTQAKNLYSSIREPEVNDKNKPDLQIWEKCWCVNIECKIADSWSGNELVKAVEHQLADKYLKHPDYQYGVLLVAYMGKKDHWEVGEDKFDFPEIMKKFQEVADQQQYKYKHIKSIKVLSIDYS